MSDSPASVAAAGLHGLGAGSTSDYNDALLFNFLYFDGFKGTWGCSKERGRDREFMGFIRRDPRTGLFKIATDCGECFCSLKANLQANGQRMTPEDYHLHYQSGPGANRDIKTLASEKNAELMVEKVLAGYGSEWTTMSFRELVDDAIKKLGDMSRPRRLNITPNLRENVYTDVMDGIVWFMLDGEVDEFTERFGDDGSWKDWGVKDILEDIGEMAHFQDSEDGCDEATIQEASDEVFERIQHGLAAALFNAYAQMYPIDDSSVEGEEEEDEEEEE
jgi:hypothetical protein